MDTLTNIEIETICNNYTNGNRKDVWEIIKNMNVKQIAKLLSQCKHYGVPTHNMITLIDAFSD